MYSFLFAGFDNKLISMLSCPVHLLFISFYRYLPFVWCETNNFETRIQTADDVSLVVWIVTHLRECFNKHALFSHTNITIKKIEYLTDPPLHATYSATSPLHRICTYTPCPTYCIFWLLTSSTPKPHKNSFKRTFSHALSICSSLLHLLLTNPSTVVASFLKHRSDVAFEILSPQERRTRTWVTFKWITKKRKKNKNRLFVSCCLKSYYTVLVLFPFSR